MIRQRLLILNGSHSELSLIKAAKELGFYVITTGNAPDGIAHKLADEYHSADFSDKDAILKLAQKLKIDKICSCANDFGCVTASYVAEKMGLLGHDSYEITLTLHHKDKFKKFALPLGIPTPYAEDYCDKKTALESFEKYRLPLIVKPIDLTGGKGISVVDTQKNYHKAIKKAFSISKAKRIVIEEFILKDAPQQSFTTFIQNQKVVFYFSDNEFSYKNPYLVSTSAAPAVSIHKVKDALINASNKIAKELDLTDGVLHHQYIVKGNKPYILEITRRCSGDLYPIPVQKATGIDWSKWIVKSSIGINCSNFPRNIKQKGFWGRHCIMSNKNGMVKNVIISDEIRNNIFDQEMWWKPGYRITNYMVQKVGIVFLQYNDMDEMLDKSARINNLIRIDIKE